MKKQPVITPDLTRAEFICCLAPTSGAVDFHGDCGVRLKLDIDESFKPEAFKVATMMGKQLRCVLMVEKE